MPGMEGVVGALVCCICGMHDITGVLLTLTLLVLVAVVIWHNALFDAAEYTKW